jgi:hypothetical protein
MTSPFSQVSQQLRSTDPAQRRQAIVALAKSDDPRAPQELERLAASDADPELRQLAARGIAFIQKRRSEASASAPTPTVDHSAGQSIPSVTPDAERPALLPPPQARVPTFEETRQARARLNHAFTMRVSGKTDAAMADLRKALELDPSLKEESSTRSLITNMTGTSGEEAIAIIMASASKPNEDVKVMATAMANGLLLFGLEVAAAGIIVFIFFFILSNQVLSLIPAQYAATPAFALLRTQLSAPGTIIGYTVGFILITIFVSFVSFFIGTMIGGSGELGNFIRIMLRVSAGCYAALVLAYVLTLDTSFSTGAMLVMRQNGLLPLGVALGTLGIQAYFAGRAHNVGILKGLGIVIGGSIASR